MDFIWKWLLAKAKDYVLNNWQTTLAGLIGGVLSAVVKDPELSKQIAAATLALVGLLSKAAGVTGTTAQPRTPPEIVEAQTQLIEAGVTPQAAVGATGAAVGSLGG